MSELIIANKADITNIADAVREQTGGSDPLTLNDIADEIRTLSAGGEAGVSVQADWQQNDETAPDYIKNRTHWIDKEFIEILPETEIGDSTYIDLSGSELFPKLTPNAKCTVTLNGVAYETTAHHYNYNAYEWYIIGNSDLLGEAGEFDTHLPFGIYVDVYNENWGESSQNVSTLKIDAINDVVIKIPDIYLPTKVGIEGTGSYSEIFNDLNNNKASGAYSHAENFETTASGYASHSEGIETIANGYSSHAEGVGTKAYGVYSHAEGYYTEANGAQTHAEGEGTVANGKNQHVSGSYNVIDTTSLVIVGNGSGNGVRSNAYKLDKNGNGYFAGDVYAKEKKLATEESVLLKAEQTLTDEELNQVRKNLHFIGKDVEGKEFTIDGTKVIASANAEIFGDYENNIAIGQWSIAEGSNTVAKGRASHAEGAFSQALADGAHVEGYQTKATGYWSHAEGEMTIVSSYASHAEGSYTKMPDDTIRYSTASGYASHVEGGGSHASGVASHAEGIGTTAAGRCAHSEGLYTVANGTQQHVEGVANIEDTNNQYIHIAGNGTSPTDRSNAYTLDWNGNGWFAGTVEATAIILRSSTPGSTKSFKITINDSGELNISENI